MPDLIIERICDQCYKSFTLKNAQEVQGVHIATMETCPHCDYKNHIWISIKNDPLSEALDRIEDMYRSDDGQAWNEAKVFLKKHNRTKFL